MKVFKFAAGLAVGYVVGSRAGREKYEQIVAAARKAQNHPAVTQAQQKAKALLGSSTDTSTPATSAALSDLSPAGTGTNLSTAPTSETPATPVPGPPRRQPKPTPTSPAAAGDPLT